jgi:hypothetical protein
VQAIISLGDLERVIGLEGVFEDELALDLGLFILDLVLQAGYLLHCAYILGVNLGLEKVEIVHLII